VPPDTPRDPAIAARHGGGFGAPADLPALPVRDHVPELLAALDAAGAAVLVAPPGTGKTTLVPLALAGHLPAGRVLVAEPRRVAVRAAAARMAWTLGEAVGERVGYAVRGERRRSARTRVEVVTTGLLVARLQRDPELDGVAAVVLDECHERHLDTDLALAFLADVRASLRPDLLLLAASATAAADPVAAALGDDGPAPVVRVPGTGHPVEIRWVAPPRPVAPPHGLRVAPALLDHVATVIGRALEQPGDVLVFLPGRGEIEGVARRLGSLPDVEILRLHGGQPAAQQDAVLAGPGSRQRVVLATAVAETSLTVPGVRTVVDAGLAREPRTDHARGLDALVTVLASRSAATQRAGRAGREAPGTVWRCWAEAEHAHRREHPDPEIAHADLTAFALALARWGTPEGRGLALLDAPPVGALAAAHTVLRSLGAVTADGTATRRGHAIAAVGVHPRLGRALLDGAERVGARRATEIVALLADDSGGAGASDDLAARWRRARDTREPRWRAEVGRLRSALPGTAGDDRGGGTVPDDLAAGLVVGLAHPDRLARPRREGGAELLMSGGTGAALGASSGLRGLPWLAVADAARGPGEATATVRLAAPLDEAGALEVGAPLRDTVTEVAWVDGDVRAETRDVLGALVLTRRPLAHPDRAAVAAALRVGLQDEGLGLLRWTEPATALRDRLAFLHAALGPPWPAVDDAALLADLDVWLGPELTGARRRADLARIAPTSALRRLVPPDRAHRLDELAPPQLTLPDGRRVRVDYTDPQAPSVALRVQQAFGWTAAPTLAGVPVVVHLLSPAGRPVAVTADLASFWAGGYRDVRAQLRGRYPKHAWPEVPPGV
jgi:ATP-dependent helicase HrpB